MSYINLLNMKNYMIIFVTLIVMGCADDATNNIEPLGISGTWKVISYEDILTGMLTTKTVENSQGMDVTIVLNDTSNPKGISGYVTTNQIFGSFSYDNEGNIQISYGSTRIAQPEWGDKFNLAMSGDNLKYKLSGTELIIVNSENQISVTLERKN